MKEKKGKIIALIIAIIVVVLAILIIPTARKMMIFRMIDAKTEKLEKSEKNVYLKIENGEDTAEVYFLNDTQKIVLNGEMVGDIIKATEDNPEPNFSNRFNHYFYTNFGETYLKAKDTQIKTVQIDGKKYYEIIETHNEENKMPERNIIYVEKNTGITKKEIRIMEEKTYTIITEYKLGTVTEADFTE